MIQAEHHSLYTPFWQWYIKNSLRSHFSSLRVYSVSELPKDTPLLWHGTHVSFWDGYLGVALAAHLQLVYRVMMLEENLSKYSFLRFAGAFGIARGNNRGTLESMRYAAAELLAAPARAMLIFPSGEIGNPHQRPIPFEAGVTALANLVAKDKEIMVCALAIRLEHGTQAKPIAFLRLGAPRLVQIGMKTSALTALLQADLEQEASALHQDLLEQNLSQYQSFLHGQSGILEFWDGIKKRFGARA